MSLKIGFEAAGIEALGGDGGVSVMFFEREIKEIKTFKRIFYLNETALPITIQARQ